MAQLPIILSSFMFACFVDSTELKNKICYIFLMLSYPCMSVRFDAYMHKTQNLYLRINF